MRRFFTWKRVTVAVVAVLALAVLAPAVTLLVDHWFARRTLGTIVAQLDRDDPDWRLDDIVRATNAELPPDDRNPFVLATAANDLLPADCYKRSADFPDWSKCPPNVMLDPPAKAKLLAAMRGMEPALDAARDLADLPEVGGNVLVMPADPMTRLMGKEQDLRLTAALLRADAVLLAEGGRTDEAVRSVRAALGTARAMGNDPTLMGQLVRMALGVVAGHAAENVIDLGEPDCGLAELQAELLREAATPKLVVGLRGDRGSFAQTSEFVLGPRLYEQIDSAHMLEFMTRHIEATNLPPEQQTAAIAAIPRPAAGDPRYLLTRLMLPAVDKVTGVARRSAGELTAVAVGIACERHRRKYGQWPATLADIPKEILPAVPTDPCDGLPIKYVRLPGRVVVYSVGSDGVDHGGLVSDLSAKAACDYGIRLYDVALRRQPAPPPVPETLPLATTDPE